MIPFKFFRENITRYQGELSREVIDFVRIYLSRRYEPNIYEITTDLATYKIVTATWSRGDICGFKISAIMPAQPRTKIFFWVAVGNVCPFITDHEVINE
jgi:hypothetical protein